MCYSTLVDRALKKIAARHRARINSEAFVDLYAMRVRNPSLKIPPGMDACAAEIGGAAGKSIELNIRAFRAIEAEQKRAQLIAVESDIAALEQRLKTKVTKTAQQQLGIKQRKRAKLLEPIPESSGDSYRIYPYQFTPVIIGSVGGREIVPMRYRVLPRTGVEIPDNYNVFNARRNSLQSVRTWNPLFGKQHAIFPFVRFFEWVERDRKKIEVTFSPDGFIDMWAASLYEECKTEYGVIRSFAMVTDEPPPEVSAAGHDRCPIFLSESLIDEWLNPQSHSLAQLDELLNHTQPTHYSHFLAA